MWLLLNASIESSPVAPIERAHVALRLYQAISLSWLNLGMHEAVVEVSSALWQRCLALGVPPDGYIALRWAVGLSRGGERATGSALEILQRPEVIRVIQQDPSIAIVCVGDMSSHMRARAHWDGAERLAAKFVNGLTPQLADAMPQHAANSRRNLLISAPGSIVEVVAQLREEEQRLTANTAQMPARALAETTMAAGVLALRMGDFPGAYDAFQRAYGMFAVLRDAVDAAKAAIGAWESLSSFSA